MSKHKDDPGVCLHCAIAKFIKEKYPRGVDEMELYAAILSILRDTIADGIAHGSDQRPIILAAFLDAIGATHAGTIKTSNAPSSETRQ